MKPVRATVAGTLLALCGSLVQANDSVGSELSHVVAGAAVASGVTVVADHYGAGEKRGWIGFWTVFSLSFVAEGIQVAADGRSQLRGSALDFGSSLIGAAFGAWVTDRYVLQPVVTKDAVGRRGLGVALQMQF